MISPAMQRCLLLQLVLQAHPEDLSELTDQALLLRRAQAQRQFLRLVATVEAPSANSAQGR